MNRVEFSPNKWRKFHLLSIFANTCKSKDKWTIIDNRFRPGMLEFDSALVYNIHNLSADHEAGLLENDDKCRLRRRRRSAAGKGDSQ